MITLITGAPGAGKTALAVATLLQEAGDRPIFVMGIPDLKIPHQPTPPVAEWTVQVKSEEDETLVRPVFTFPEHSIIVIDEAQNVYRPRPVGSKVPDIVAAFETHRHTGVDFWLITQSPALIDANVRRLVGRHLHIRATALGRYLYEWPETGDPESKTSRDASARRRYHLPKKVFSQYRSATVHLKPRHTIPPAVWIGLFALLVLAILGFFSWKSINKKIHSQVQDVPSKAEASVPIPDRPLAASAPVAQSLTADQLIEQWKPRIEGQPETAPLYDSLRVVRQMPRLAACIATKKRCQCYTQQGTLIDTDEALCRATIERGGRFDPYLDTEQRPRA